jgi:hypothetical protein
MRSLFLIFETGSKIEQGNQSNTKVVFGSLVPHVESSWRIGVD